MMLRNSAARQGYRFLFNNTYGAAARTWSRSFAADAAAAPAVAASVDKVADQKPRHTRTRREFDLMNVYDAVAVCKQNCWAKFDESIDIAVQLGVDPRKPNQAIKGVAQLPHGNGKKVRVCVFATGDVSEERSLEEQR